MEYMYNYLFSQIAGPSVSLFIYMWMMNKVNMMSSLHRYLKVVDWGVSSENSSAFIILLNDSWTLKVQVEQ